jgi:hypothetical protein
MAPEALIMAKDTLNKLKNEIMNQRYVNCYSRQFSPESPNELERFLSDLKNEYNKNIYLEINIRAFEACETEEAEVKALLELLNKELAEKGLVLFQGKAYSMSTAISKWSETLDSKALLVFHCFHDRYSEKEKDILRSLRKTLRDKNELSSYLGILIISNRKVSTWELFPESNLDDRHVIFYEY